MGIEKVGNRNYDKTNIKLEVMNSISHGIGVPLGITFLILLIIKQVGLANVGGVVSYAIYGACFILLFLSSCLYHAIPFPKAKSVLRIFDHVSIYVFIAGSFTPGIILLTHGFFRIAFLILIWTLAIGGTVFKIVTRGNYDRWKNWSTALYVAMGWLGLFFIYPIIKERLWEFFLFIVLGGVLYTVGTFFYKDKKLKYGHFIWHIFVLAAAVTQFVGYYCYL